LAAISHSDNDFLFEILKGVRDTIKGADIAYNIFLPECPMCGEENLIIRGSNKCNECLKDKL